MSIADAMSKMGGHGGIAEKAPKHEEPREHEGGGVHEHLQALHAKMGGKHMHVHSDGFTHTTHHIGEDGKVEGPHEHEDGEALKAHVGKVMDGEEHEGSHSSESDCLM